MQTLRRKATLSTPEVILDPESNTYTITGRSLPIEADLFYKPLLNWFDEIIEAQSVKSLQLQIKLEYFNIASSKRLLFILYKLVKLQEQGVHVLVRWMYESNDTDMHEIGRDYSVMVEDLHFIFESYVTVFSNPVKAQIHIN